RRAEAAADRQEPGAAVAKSAGNGRRAAFRTVQNTYFRNTTIALDGHEYAGCDLWDCRLVFQGQASFSIHDCRLGGCHLVFEGAAQTTLGTLRALYQDMSFRPIVEHAIKQITGAVPARPGPI